MKIAPARLSSLVRGFALIAFTICASFPLAFAAETLRYDFEAIADPAVDPVLNTAPAAIQDGAFVNPANVEIIEGEVVTVNSIRYGLGKSLKFNNATFNPILAGYIDTGLNPTGWRMANGDRMNRNYTAMAWVKFNNLTGDNMVFGQFPDGSLHLGTRGGGFHSGHWGDDITASTKSAVATWQHVAFVNEFQSQSIYVNGSLIAGPGSNGDSTGVSTNLLIGTWRNEAFEGSIDDIKIFGDEALSAARIAQEMTRTLTPLTLANVSSATLDNTGFHFTIQDFAPGSIVNLASVALFIDTVAVTPTSVSKTAGLTTVTFNLPAPPYGSGTAHTYTLSAKDGSNPATPNITKSGTLTMPVLAALLPGPVGTTSSWGMREYRANADFAGNWNNNSLATVADALRDLPGTDPDPATNDLVDTPSVPVMNHTDPDEPGHLGNFNNDFPYPGHTAGLPDNNIAFLGKTSLVIPAPGTYTFSVHSGDGFALRINGGPPNNTSRFLSSNRTSATNGIDPADPRTLFFTGGTADAYTTGVYQFTAAGTYTVNFVSYSGTGNSFHEVAWTPGAFLWDYQTTTWQLLGSPNDPAVLAIPYQPRFINPLPGPSGTAHHFGLRVYLNAFGGSTAASASNWLANNAATRFPDDTDTFDLQRNFINFSDIRDNATSVLQNQGYISNDDVLPGGFTNQNNVITTAKARITVATPAVYTFSARGDDGFLLRLKAISGPHPKFTRVSHPSATDGNPGLEMSNLNEFYYSGETGDSLTRGIIFLPAGQYDLEYLQWERGNGYWYELTAAVGDFPHGTEPPTGWFPVGFSTPAPPPNTQPNISAAGWTVASTPSEAVTTFTIAGAQAALAAGATTSNWDSINFTDPENGGGPISSSPSSAWPRNTPADDNNYAMRATSQLIVPTTATYQLGYLGDDGGYLIIRSTGGRPNPSFDPSLVSNLTGVGTAEPADPTNTPNVLNKLRTELGTGNSQTIGRITLTPGTYDLETLFYEGGNGSFWRVVGGIEPLATPGVWNPLSKGGNVAVQTMLPLVTQALDPIPVTDWTMNPSTGAFSLTFASLSGATYQFEYSTTMQVGISGVPDTWNPAPSGTIIGAAGTTTVTGNIAAFHPSNGGVLPLSAPRAFFRIRRL